MIYLIGGVPRCGKTTVAQKLSKALEISLLPADYLTSVAMAFVPKSDLAMKFPLYYKKRVRLEKSNDEYYRSYSPSQIVQDYLVQAKTTWIGIRKFIEYASSEEQDYIIEGYQIQPEFVQELKTSKLHPRIRAVFLYKKDVDDILDGIHMGNLKTDWSLQHTKNKETLNKIAEFISIFGERIESQARKYKFSVVNMERDFTKQVDGVVDDLKQ